MSIKVKQVAHVCIFAKDLAETRDFYQNVLGLPIVFNFNRKGEWYGFYLDAGGRSNVEVFLKPEASYGPENAITHFCLEVENIDDAVAHIKSQGVPVTDKKYACDDTFQAWIRDPNDVKIELFEYTEKSAQFAGGDRIADW